MFCGYAQAGSRRLITAVVLAAGMVLPGSRAKAQDDASPRVVVGELTGMWDPDQFVIPTSKGIFPVLGSNPEAPFVAQRNGEHEIVVRFRSAQTDNSRHPGAVVYRLFTKERSLISSLILEEVDFAELRREESAIEVRESNPAIVRLPRRLPPNTATLIFYNHRLPVFQSRTVRRAISQAIDRRKIVRDLLGGKATVARGPLDDVSWAYASELSEPRFDPRQSVRMLAQAGWVDRDADRVLDKDGRRLEFTLAYPEGLLLEEQLVRRIKLWLFDIGIHVRPLPKPLAELHSDLVSGNFEAVFIDLRFEESGEDFEAYFGSGGAKNFSGFRNRLVDRYVQLYKQSNDRDIRRKLLQAMQLVLSREQPVSFLYFKWWTYFLVNSAKLEDVRDGQGGILPFDQWTLKPPGRLREP